MLRSFLSDRRGAIAVVFAFAITPLIAVAGLGIDYSRIAAARDAAQAAVDAAALVGVTGPSSFERERASEAAARQRLQSLPYGAQQLRATAREEIDAKTGARRMVVDATIRVPLTFTSVWGFGTKDVPVVAEAETSGRAFEIVLVVDVTGSMRGARIDALRRSAASFVRLLLDEGEVRADADKLRVAIVPYTASVNIHRERMAWLSPGPGGLTAIAQNRYVFGEEEVSRDRCRGEGVTWNATLRLCHMGPLSTWTQPGPCPGVTRNGVCYVADNWMGCVMERVGTGHELDDEPPRNAPFRPYYWASWGGVGNASAAAEYNSYLPEPIDETRRTNGTSNNGRGPNLGCPQNPIVSWTRDRNRLLAEIASFEAWHRGGTMGHVGLLWGWRMLSPRWRGSWEDPKWPHDYDAANVEKIVVFMTDGDNLFFSGMAPPNDSDYTAYGRLSANPGYTRSNNTRLLDEKMIDVCTRMRGLGIELFTVGFHVSNNARDLLRRCATSSRHAFDSDTTTLERHFARIATEIRERRVRLLR